jgi:hypothetical protein
LTLTATGTTPVNFALTGTPAPIGVSISGGQLVVTPAVAVGTHTFTITATNEAGSVGQNFTLTVNRATQEPVPPIITSANSLTVVEGIGGSLALTATGTEPIQFALTGTPAPSGVSISGGQLVVAPAVTEGTYTFTITATNEAGNVGQNFTLTVNQPTQNAVPPVITSVNTLSVWEGTGGSLTLTATGTTPIQFALTGAPAGVSISNTNQLIVASTAIAGTFPFTITATNEAGSVTQSFTLTISTTTTGTTSPTITSTNTLRISQGNNISVPLTATGTTPISFTLTNAPSGVTISNNQLVVASTVAVGTHAFIITATNQVGTYPQVFTLTVDSVATPPAISSVNNLTVWEGTGGSLTLTATGTSPITYSLVGAPTGVSINGNRLIIAATVTEGTRTFTIRATNSAGSNQQTFTLTVNRPAIDTIRPTIISANSLTVCEDEGGNLQLLASGTTPIRFELTGAPAGVSINHNNQLVIAPGVATGTRAFVITAINEAGYVLQNFVLTVTASERRVIRFNIDNTLYTINGRYHQSDVAPFIDPSYNRTMVPIRVVAEALGAQVDWDSETRTAIIILGRTIFLPADDPLPGGDMGRVIFRYDRILVPIRYVAQELGAGVRWDGENNAAYIYL